MADAIEGRSVELSVVHYGMNRTPAVLLRVVAPGNAVCPERCSLTADQAMDLAADLVAAAKGLRELETTS